MNQYDAALYRKKYRIKSIRLPNWDYSADGYYFVTICTKNSELFFGNVQNGIMGLNELGCIACEQWLKTAQLRKNVILDEWVVMPNHVHGIIIINNTSPVETRRDENIVNPAVETRRGASLRGNAFGPLKSNSLQSIINHFKGAVTQLCRKNGYHQFKWQTRFYDHIIRNEESLNNIRQYILNNPWKWEQDRNNPENLFM